MLLGYGGKNCWCFKEWMQVDLTLKESVPADVSMNLPATTALCFKGANAAGKTNALKVFGFIVDFARNSFNYKPESDIHFDSFFSNDEPGEFYVEFISKENFYRYNCFGDSLGDSCAFWAFVLFRQYRANPCL